MSDLASDLAAMRARCENLPALPDIVAYAADAIADRKLLLARLEEMQEALEGVKESMSVLRESWPQHGVARGSFEGAFSGCDKAIDTALRPLQAPG